MNMQLTYFVTAAIAAWFLGRWGGMRKVRKLENELSRLDSLTGAINRKAFYDIAGNELKRLRRYKHPFTVAYMDIDNFKMINYKFGHSAGDSLLRAVTQALKSSTRDVDVISRFGGDEFAILLPETPAEPSQLVLSRLKTRLLETMDKNAWPVTFSFGAVTFLTPPSSVEEIIKKATVLMYSAKNSGSNTVDQEVFGGGSEGSIVTP